MTHPGRALAEHLFAALREATSDGVGITRECYEAGENAAIALFRETAERNGLKTRFDAAANLVVDSPRRHAVAGVQHHLDSLGLARFHGVAQQKGRFAGAGKFWGGAEAAEFGIVFPFEDRRGVAKQSGGEKQIVGLPLGKALQFLVEIPGRLQHLVMARIPKFGDLAQHLQETGVPVPAFRG